MNSNLYPAIFAAAGAIVGTIIGKLIELFVARRQHRYNLERDYYAKKAAVYEKVVAVWTFTYQSLQSILLILQKAYTAGLDADESVVNSSTQNIVEQLAELKKYMIEAAALNLYFQIEDDEAYLFEKTSEFFEIIIPRLDFNKEVKFEDNLARLVMITNSIKNRCKSISEKLREDLKNVS